MIRNSKGELIYIRYGSSRGWKCTHCGQTLTAPPIKEIYMIPWMWHKDGAGRVRCNNCNNLAERV